MRVKKRKKSTRFRGSHTHGRGFKKKARGKGHQGGKGMAGTGKRGDQKKSLVINLFGNDYFGKDRALRGRDPSKVKSVDLKNVVDRLDSYVRKGIAKENKGTYEIDLSEYKILATGEIKVKMIIKAKAASASAHEKVKKAGGEVIVENSESE